jgi:hypothetical protein
LADGLQELAAALAAPPEPSLAERRSAYTRSQSWAARADQFPKLLCLLTQT